MGVRHDFVGNLRVLVEEGAPHGGLYELEQTTYYRVVDSRSNEVLLIFQGQMEASLSTETGMWDDYRLSGVCAVLIGPGERSVTVRYHDGHEELVPVPHGDRDVAYKVAPPCWSYTDANPFTTDGSYGLAWSAFCILDRDDDQFYTGQVGDGPFSVRCGRRVAHLEHRLIDLLHYENAHGRLVILQFPKDLDVDAFVAHALAQTPPAGVVRPDDPAFIVHSTALAAWDSIRADGLLKAASGLEARPRLLDPSSELGRYLQHEPPEYGDYIMFGELGSTTPEKIVASYRAGRFMLDDDAVYEPGVRLYFDNHRIIRDRRITRDGLHATKVYRQLPLSPYLLAAIRVVDLDPHREIEAWTPRAFAVRADQAFCRR
jgi:hypothetical protein